MIPAHALSILQNGFIDGVFDEDRDFGLVKKEIRRLMPVVNQHKGLQQFMGLDDWEVWSD